MKILENMASGRALTLIPSNAELSTQEAADVLNVSRPFLVKLLDEGRIPCRRVGTHRKIMFSDLMHYKAKDDSERERVRAELTEEAQKLGLGY